MTKKLSLAEMVAAAKTSADHAKISQKLDRQIKQAEAQLREFETSRERVALSGENVADHSRQFFEIGETIKTLGVALEASKARQEEAEKREAREDIEAKAKEAQALTPELREGWKAFYAALRAVNAAAAKIDATAAKISELTYPAKRAGLGELLTDIHGARAAAAEECEKPFLGDRAVGVRYDADNIARAAYAAVEVALFLGVHNRDEYTARRSHVLVNVKPMKTPDGREVVEMISLDGRPLGGLDQAQAERFRTAGDAAA